MIKKAHLPTFQSNAIEVNLHRVPNLTEKFVYFNDDMGLISPTCPSNFWTEKDGYFMFPTMEVKCRSKCTSDLLMNGECNKGNLGFEKILNNFPTLDSILKF